MEIDNDMIGFDVAIWMIKIRDGLFIFLFVCLFAGGELDGKEEGVETESNFIAVLP